MHVPARQQRWIGASSFFIFFIPFCVRAAIFLLFSSLPNLEITFFGVRRLFHTWNMAGTGRASAGKEVVQYPA